MCLCTCAWMCVCLLKEKRNIYILKLTLCFNIFILFFDEKIGRMVEERVKLCDEHLFQCSICCNDIDDKTNVYEIELCHCQFCKEVGWHLFLSFILEIYIIYSFLVCTSVLFQSSKCSVR